MTTALTIASTSIRQDEHGRFCLNDLHKASGEEARHAPALWQRSGEVVELVVELAKDTNSYIKPLNAVRGRYGGTYAVKELVYAYAAWVSADFHITVLEAYDALVVNGGTRAAAPTTGLSRLEILQLALDSEQKRLELEERLAVVAPKAEAVPRCGFGLKELLEGSCMLQQRWQPQCN